MSENNVNYNNCEAKVALDLMYHIAGNEKLEHGKEKDRTYWLTLYSQCRRATANALLDKILKASQNPQ